jgi:hypothetical protein
MILAAKRENCGIYPNTFAGFFHILPTGGLAAKARAEQRERMFIPAPMHARRSGAERKMGHPGHWVPDQNLGH